MIVLGIDPGGRETGLAAIDTDQTPGGTPALLWSNTVRRVDVGPLTYVPRDYLAHVNASALLAIRELGVDLIAVERVEAPKGFAGGKRHMIDPAGLLACSVVFGTVFGRTWTIPVVAVRAGGNGRHLPLNRYPHPIATAGKGHDKRRHERSAYDVACQGPLAARLATQEGYA